MLADGRLNTSAVLLLVRCLTHENAGDLLAAAAGKTRAEIETLLAGRFLRPDLPGRVQALPASQLSPGTVGVSAFELSPGTVGDAQVSPGQAQSSVPRPCVTPLAPERYGLQLTMGEPMHEKLRYAQALLGHAVPSGAVAEVLERALDALIVKLEKQKFAAASRPRAAQGKNAASGRHIPARVKRVVWERDRGCCTFTSKDGHRCRATRRVEFDHIEPVARGGRSTVSNLRLRCRAHNQYEAEQALGNGLMHEQRERAGRAAAERRARAGAAKKQVAAEPNAEQDVTPYLRHLGFRAEEARRAADHCESLGQASLEQRVRAALSFLSPPARIGGAVRLAAAVPTASGNT
jgi:hypothetical protein